jgi:hypothetical protein
VRSRAELYQQVSGEIYALQTMSLMLYSSCIRDCACFQQRCLFSGFADGSPIVIMKNTYGPRCFVLSEFQREFMTGRSRRQFLRLIAVTGATAALRSLDPATILSQTASDVVASAPLHKGPGMPGPFPGRVVEVASTQSIVQNHVNSSMVRRMMERGITELTGAKTPPQAWQALFNKQDVVGIKINASGVPGCVSSPEVVNEIVFALNGIGIPNTNIFLYERFPDQIDLAGYHAYVPGGVKIIGIETRRLDLKGYDKNVYFEVNFFGEEDTRSYLAKCVTSQFTKIINVPCLKDHDASGVTGCLKNISYGSFNNVARSHKTPKTHTKPFIGQLCNIEPLRSKTVLQIMDGLRGVYHGGPFAPNQKFMWFPGVMYFGTDPVAIDRVELEVIEAKRKEVGVISVWERSPQFLSKGNEWRDNPNLTPFFREPGHIEHAGSLGLGIADLAKIEHLKLKV